MIKTKTLSCAARLAAVVLFTAGMTVAASAAEGGKVKVDKTTAVPANYRQLIARALLTRSSAGPILAAEISHPSSGEDPFVCVKYTAQGPWIKQDYSEGFKFKSGQIAQRFNPLEVNPALGGAFGALLRNEMTCGSLSYLPFKEVVKRK